MVMDGRNLTDYDIYLFKEGSHARIYECLGSHPHGTGCTSRYGLPKPGAYLL
jgi:hypothetical protein